MHYKEDLVQETILHDKRITAKPEVADFPNLVRKKIAQRIRLG
jgi:hypothetical protein